MLIFYEWIIQIATPFLPNPENVILESHKITFFIGQKWLKIVISYASTLYVRLLYITSALKPVRKKMIGKKEKQ